MLGEEYERTFVDLSEPENDAITARQAAQGLGIDDDNIIHLQDSSTEELNKVFDDISKEFRILSKQNKPTLLFVFCTGYGVVVKE